MSARTMNGPAMADETVLINCLDGSFWVTVEGHRVAVSGWRPMPEPMGGAI